VWFGSIRGGASRFDGKAWTTYSEADGLVDNSVTAIAVASDGTVWFGTYDSGASRFDGQAWTTYKEARTLASNSVKAIAVAPDGAVWFGTEGRCLPL